MYKITIKNKLELSKNLEYFDMDNNIVPYEASMLDMQFNLYGNSYISAGFGDIIICSNADFPILRGHLPTIGSIEVENIIGTEKSKLKIFDMYQNIEETIPRFEITAEDFQVYRWVDDGRKDENGYTKYPLLKEFIEWYEKEESK